MNISCRTCSKNDECVLAILNKPCRFWAPPRKSNCAVLLIAGAFWVAAAGVFVALLNLVNQ